MSAFRNLVGETFGRLTVLSRAPNKGRRTMFNCKCECGTIKPILSEHLTSNHTQSCGCLQREKAAVSVVRTNKTHAMSNTPEYISWRSMLQRVNNPNHTYYERYGGRGITIDPSWLSFERFFSDMGCRPEGTTLERKDNNQGYSKDNCIWADWYVQSNNKESSRVLTLNGESKTCSQWCRALGMKPETLNRRLNAYGWSVERALKTPVKQQARRVSK